MHIKCIDEQAGIYEVHLHPIEEQKIRDRFPGPNTPMRIGNALRCTGQTYDDQAVLDSNMIMTYE